MRIPLKLNNSIFVEGKATEGQFMSSLQRDKVGTESMKGDFGKYSVVIIGPSQRFLSGISYFTLMLSNALANYANVSVVLFRNMLPKHLFPGWKRVGKGLTQYCYRGDIQTREVLDWYNPVTWVQGSKFAGKGDVIIFQWWTSSVAHMYLAIALLNIGRKPIIIEFHEIVDPLESGFILLRLYSRITGTLIRKFSKGYVVHSDADRMLISSHYGIDTTKVRVIPHGIYDQYRILDKNDAKKHLEIQESNVILFFGLLRPYKGVKFLIEAFEQLPSDLVNVTRLLIVGEAWEDQETYDRVKISPRISNITLINRYVGDDEVPYFFSVADILVIPYTRASQSGVAHIGMAYGIPIVASRVGGLEEGLGKYKGTRFVNPENTIELTKALELTLSEREEYDPPEELRWERIAEQWISLIDEVAPKR